MASRFFNVEFTASATRRDCLQNINAEIIAIGTELLLGELVDSNSAHIARVFRGIGINVYMMTTVGDNRERIAMAIRNGLNRADIVITTGGLGPTVDDMTRHAVADATERSLVYHPELFDQIATRFAGFRVRMTENNRQQAFLPEDAILIDNPVGTAPSFIVKNNDGTVISLPGVPREMKFLLADQVVPYLSKQFRLGTIIARVLRTAGIGESSLDDLLGTDLLNRNNPTIGLAAHSGQVDVRITAKHDSEEAALQLIAETEATVRTRIGPYVYGTGDEELADAFLQLLVQQKQNVSLIAAGIVDVIGAQLSEKMADGGPLWNSHVFPNAEELARQLGLAPDTPLRVLAENACQHYLKDDASDLAIAVVSYDDDYERIDDDAGTTVAVANERDSASRSYGFGGRHSLARLWVTSWGLARGWRMLKSNGDGDG
ncbi:MAG: CinA family nicotinamide mononucleotide deamidase-related protein [Anaerolineaceae bacterium]|nr:CinA family nicotinamide mononucleotide deamidase-related protein [Anaerolineaceae bacterium]